MRRRPRDEADGIAVRSAVRGAAPSRRALRGCRAARSRSPSSPPTSARCSSRGSPTSRSKASCPTASCGTPGHLYFTLKDAGAQIRGVMFRSAARMPEVQGRGRPARRRARPRERLRRQGRVPDRLRGARAPGTGRAAAGVRAVEEAARRPPGCSIRRASGRCRCCRGRSAWSPRSTARRFATSSRCSAKRYPQAHVVIRPARVQGDGAAQDIARGAADDRARRRASTS